MMKCSKAQRLISDRMDHRLTAEQNDRLDHHFETCSDCLTVAVEMNQVVVQAGALEVMSPSTDLWPSIRKQVMAKDRGPTLSERMVGSLGLFRHPLLAPAITCIVIVLLAVVWLKPNAVRNSTGLLEVAMTPEQVRAVEAHYLKAIDVLSRDITEHASRLSPELEVVFRRSIQVVDASIVSVKATMEHHHAGAAAGPYLMTCYQRKIEILNQIRETMASSV